VNFSARGSRSPPNKEPPQPTEDVFDEFIRSRGKH
jgi:hypothetical protein